MSKNKFFFLGIITAIAFAFGVFFITFAPHPISAITVEDFSQTLGLGSAGPKDIVINIINWALGLLSLIAVVLVLYAGFMWMTAAGDEKKIEKAKKILIGGLIGLILILAAWGIVWYVLNKLNESTGNANNFQCTNVTQCDAQLGPGPWMCCSGSCLPDSGSCSGFPGGNTGFSVDGTIPRDGQEGVSLCSIIGAHFNAKFNVDTLTSDTTDTLDPAVFETQGYSTSVIDNFELTLVEYDSDGDGTMDTTGAASGGTCTENKECASALCEDTDGDAIKDTCTGDEVAGTVKVSSDHQWVVLYPDGRELPKFSHFQAQVDNGSSGVKTETGVSLSGVIPYTWEFFTSDLVDSTPPQVNSGTEFPQDGSTALCRATHIESEFNEVMDPISFNDDVSVVLSQDPSFSPTIPMSISPQQNAFISRPNALLTALTTHYVRLYGGNSAKTCVGGDNDTLDCSADATLCDAGGGKCQQFAGALQDTCGNPLDGNRNATTEGSPVDDFISTDDANSPWDFTTDVEENTVCNPLIETITPVGAYDGLDTTNNGPDSGDNGGNGDPGRVQISGRFFSNHPVVTFTSDNTTLYVDSPACFDKEEKVIESSTPPVAQCFVEHRNTFIDLKIPPQVKDIGSITVSVAPATSDPSSAFDPYAPHIDFPSPADGNVGTYVTLFGRNFGTTAGNVWFRKQDGTNILGAVPPCANTWSDTEVLTMVPPGINVGDIVDIQIETFEDKRGNLVEFTGSDKDRPNLCAINPSCANEANKPTEFSGERFGTAQGQIKFGPTAGSVTNWADQLVKVNTPNLDNSIYVASVVNSTGLESNGRSFKVPCGNVPQVEDEPACDVANNIYPSTNPRPNATNVCLNIKAAARFTTQMNISSTDPAGILNTANVKLYTCGTSSDVPSNETCLAGTLVAATLAEDPEYAGEKRAVLISPSAPFAKETWYAIWISGNVKSDLICFGGANDGNACATDDDCADPGLCGGVPMDNDFFAKFKTKADDGACPVVALDVEPDGGVTVTHSASAVFSGNPVGPNCALLNAADYNGDYAWSSSNTSIGTLSTPINTSTDTVSTVGNAHVNEGSSLINATLQGHSDTESFTNDLNFCEDSTDCECGATCTNHKCESVITGINPPLGPVGRSVTVNGCYFGTTQESGDVVKFNNTDAQLLDFCPTTTWSDRQIIVEVPSGFNVGDTPNVTVTNVDDTDTFVSNQQPFEISNLCVDIDGHTTPQPSTGIPVLCPPVDNSVATGDTAQFTGRHFTSSQDQSAGDEVYYSGSSSAIDGATYPTWNDTAIDSVVPNNSISGNVYAANDKCLSNSVRVGIFCNDSTECGSGCCNVGAHECRNATECQVGSSGQLCKKTSVPACNIPAPETPPPGHLCLGADTDGDAVEDNDCRFCCTPGQVFNTLVCEPDIASCTSTNGNPRGAYCGCTDDSVCPGNTVNGCGNVNGKQCCLGRPFVESTNPAAGATNVCRNALVSFTFNSLMKADSINDTNIIVKEVSTNTVINNIGDFRLYNQNNKTTVEFVLNSLLPDAQGVSFLIKGDPDPTDPVTVGVQNQYGIAMAGNSTFAFTTSGEICGLAQVNLDSDLAPLYTFNTDGQQSVLTAQAKADAVHGNQIITPIPNVYDWKWNWTSDTNTIINVQDSETTGNDPNTNAFHFNTDGEATLTATALPLATPVGYNDDIADDLQMYVFYCQDPWSATIGGPGFEDIDGVNDEAGNLAPLHQVIRYCRDGHTAQSNFDKTIVKSTDLPQGVYREYLFTQSNASSQKNGIGVRVYRNDDRLNAIRWYQNHTPNATANYSVLTKGVGGVNKDVGYEAIQVGTAVYIAGANHTSGGIYPNIYIISYNEGSDSETIEIFNEMLNNWIFNTNVPTSKKSKLIRDTKRVTDIGGIADALNAYKTANGSYPNLTAGTFLRRQSTSKWESWHDVLADSIGYVPVDPINAFSPLSMCDPANGFDEAQNCWKPIEKEYHCPNNGTGLDGAPWDSGASHVYQYKVPENDHPAKAYLFANLEYEYNGLTWALDTDGDGAIGPALNPCNGTTSQCSCFNYGYNLQNKRVIEPVDRTEIEQVNF